MARLERFKISHARKVDSAFRSVSEAFDAGVICLSAEGGSGRYVELDGQRCRNFGSCSYMGLELMPQLTEAAHEALKRYGTQFSISRAYLQSPLYLELEDLLERIAGRPVLVTPTTTLGHMAALPVLIRDDDTIIIDQFAHASLHTAVQLLPNVPLEILRHNRLDQLSTRLAELRRERTGKVWYIGDGLYSMLGDYAPFEGLKQLLDEHDNLRLYIDDAHSTSWLGQHGRGIALEHFADDERVVVALSLNKAFSAAGGALAVPNRAMYDRIRLCGGPMLFSGPIQPPMLGAAVGSARLHLSDAFPALQAELQVKLAHAQAEIARAGLRLATLELSTIFQAQCPSPRIVYAVNARMRARGFYCCICIFPAVPLNRPGIRFTISRHNALEDIGPFISALRDAIDESVAALEHNPARLPLEAVAMP